MTAASVRFAEAPRKPWLQRQGRAGARTDRPMSGTVSNGHACLCTSKQPEQRIGRLGASAILVQWEGE